MRQLLDDFEEGAEAGVTRLLAAFYCRQSGARSNERTFEFTHKSFGEYLTARRIVRAMTRIHKQLERRQEDIEEGWDKREALHHWAEVCGPTRMDIYLLNFLRDEVALRPSDQVAQWQRTFSDLIGVMLRQGMPMEKIEPPLKFYEANRRAIHGEEALLAALNACSQVTQNISTVDWPAPESFGAWIGRLQGQRTNNDKVVSLYSLERLGLSLSVLIGRDLSFVSLSEADLSEADLSEANLRSADLSFADLRSAGLRSADLSEVELRSADLRSANLRSANLRSADLINADLSEADLSNANLRSADLTFTNLSDTNLSDAAITNTQFGFSVGLSTEEKQNLIKRGAIFDDD